MTARREATNGTVALVWNAERDETRRLPPGRRGVGVRVESGLLLVTQSGDPVDHVLGPGESLWLEGAGLGVAWALEPSRVLVERGPRPDGGLPSQAPTLAA